VASGFATAREILSYAKEEPDKALKLHDVFLYRNAADKAFLALLAAINTYLEAKLGAAPKSHTEKRQMLSGQRGLARRLQRPHEDTTRRDIHEGIYQPEEVKYAAEEIIDALEKELLEQHTHLPQPPSKGAH